MFRSRLLMNAPMPQDHVDDEVHAADAVSDTGDPVDVPDAVLDAVDAADAVRVDEPGFRPAAAGEPITLDGPVVVTPPIDAPRQEEPERAVLGALLVGGLGLGVAVLGGASGGAGGASSVPAGIGAGVPKPPAGHGAPSLEPAGPADRPHEDTPGATAVLGLQVLATTTRPDGTPLTNNGTVSVIGIEAGATWRYSFDGGQTWTPGTGESIPGTAAGTDGIKTVLVYQTDTAGLDSGRASLTFELDKTPPRRPLLVLKNDTGGGSVDTITSDPAVLIQQRDPDTTLKISIDNGEWQTWTSDEIPGTLFGDKQGGHSIAVVQTDPAGNAKSASLEITLDTLPPLPPQLVLATAAASNAVLGA